MLRGTSFLPRVLRRVPFAIALATAVLLVTIVTGTMLRKIPFAELEAWGFSAADLAHGRWSHLALATFQVLEPYLGLCMLATILALVGSCEYRFGTLRTAFVYALAQIVGLFAVIAVAKLFAERGSTWGRLLLVEPNVGASPGAIGTLGAWLMGFPRRVRWWGIALCAAFLIVAFGGDVHPWDVAHAAAFLIGIAVGARLQPERRAPAGAGFDRWLHTRLAERRTAVAWMAAIVGVVMVLMPFAVAETLPLARLLARHAARGGDVMRWMCLVAGVSLLGSASGLRRGNMRSWRAALGATVLVAGMLWQPGAPGVDHVLSILLVVSLVAWRHDFTKHAIARPPGPAARVAVAILICTLAYVVLMFVSLREQFVPPLRSGGMLHAAMLRLRFHPIPSPNWDSPAALWFLGALPWLVYGAAAAAALVLARSFFVPGRHRDTGSAGRSGETE